MLHWIRRGTRLFTGLMFFTVLISSLVTAGSFSYPHLLNAVLFASIAAIISWFAGFIVSDIVLKGMITHIDAPEVDTLLDGGLLQQIKEMQEKLVPGGAEQPFTEIQNSRDKKDASDKQKK